MRILVIGATGLLGTAVVQALRADHEVLEASRQGQHKVDLRDPDSITALYAATAPVDAVACAAGVTPFAPLADLRLDDFRAGLQDKLLGQIEVVRQGIDHVSCRAASASTPSAPPSSREAWDAYGEYFPGHRPVAVAEVARAYVKSIAGAQTGQAYRVGY